MQDSAGATFVEYVIALVLLGLVLLGASQLLVQSSRQMHNAAINDLNNVNYQPFAP